MDPSPAPETSSRWLPRAGGTLRRRLLPAGAEARAWGLLGAVQGLGLVLATRAELPGSVARAVLTALLLGPWLLMLQDRRRPLRRRLLGAGLTLLPLLAAVLAMQPLGPHFMWPGMVLLVLGLTAGGLWAATGLRRRLPDGPRDPASGFLALLEILGALLRGLGMAALLLGLAGIWLSLAAALGVRWPDLLSRRLPELLTALAGAALALSLAAEPPPSAAWDRPPALVRALSRLLPFAALLVLGSLGLIAWQGQDRFLALGHPSLLLLGLGGGLLLLVQAAWLDGRQPGLLPPPPARLLRLALLTLPLLVALAGGSLGLRVAQHGWSVDRVLVALAIGLAGLAALAAALAAARGSGLPNLGPALARVAQLGTVTVLLLPTAAVDLPRRIADHQVGRLLDGRVSPQAFDWRHLDRLGPAGQAARSRLAGLRDHPEAEAIRNLAAQASPERHAARPDLPPARPSPAEIRARLQPLPAGAEPEAEWLEALAEAVVAGDHDGGGRWLREPTVRPALRLDLDGDGQEEWLLFQGGRLLPAVAWGRDPEDGAWRPRGRLERRGGDPGPLPADWLDRIQAGEVQLQAPRWRELSLGGQRLGLRELSGGR